MTALSIIVTVYNLEDCVERCLKSLAEAVAGMEDETQVLLVDDGSTDGSAEILRAWCGRCACMELISRENGGRSAAKNSGLAAARGEYVIFLDGDDCVRPEMYREMLARARATDADVVVCDMELVWPDHSRVVSCTEDPLYAGRADAAENEADAGRKTVTAAESDANGRKAAAPTAGKNECAAGADDLATFRALVSTGMMSSACNKLVRRRLYRGVRFPVGLEGDDVAVVPVVLARAGRIEVIHEPYYRYIQREGSIQNSRFDERRFTILDTSRICLRRMKKDGAAAGKFRVVRDTLYVHQILENALYHIRFEPWAERRRLLEKYMRRAEYYFTDLWEADGVRHYAENFDKPLRYVTALTLRLLRARRYGAVCALWEVLNRRGADGRERMR